MSDKRKTERNQLATYLNVFDRNTDQLLGYMADFSNEGMMLVSKTPVQVGVVFECRAILTKLVAGQGQVTFDAESRWCDHDSNLYALYNTGFLFIDVSPENLAILEEWFHEAVFHE